MASPLSSSSAPDLGKVSGYRRFLLFVAGLGGLLYGVDVGLIGGALPYLQATSRLSPGQLSIIVAAVLLGSTLSTLFAGTLADWMGRKPLMVISGLAFVLSIPVIALSHGYGPLFLGRLLQGVSGGLIGLVVPLYLAECLAASNRGKGTGIFQLLLTFGIFAAALIGIYYSYRVEAVAQAADAAALFDFKNQAWRRIFWVSLPPGLLFVLGALLVSESPRWLFRKGHTEAALKALRRSRLPEEADAELREMEQLRAAAPSADVTGKRGREPLLRRKYVIPFVLACLILACNTATGVNSVIGYDTSILLQAGLSDLYAHWGYVALTAVNFLLTIGGMLLVDRKGRRFLLTLGTAGIFVSLLGVGLLFLRTEKLSVDARAAVQRRIVAQPDGSPDQGLTLRFNPGTAKQLLAESGYRGSDLAASRASLAIIYSCGDYTAATSFARSDDPAAAPVQVSRAECLPANGVEAFFKDPFGNLRRSRMAPIRIERALVGAVPEQSNGLLVALGLYLFMGFYAVGPGVCVWLALSELMPTRIRSNGMSVALVLNQAVAATLQGIFLPFVSKHGYARMFFLFAAFTLCYFLVATLFLPETKGKTLEEIESHFEGRAGRLQEAR